MLLGIVFLLSFVGVSAAEEVCTIDRTFSCEDFVVQSDGTVTMFIGKPGWTMVNSFTFTIDGQTCSMSDLYIDNINKQNRKAVFRDSISCQLVGANGESLTPGEIVEGDIVVVSQSLGTPGTTINKGTIVAVVATGSENRGTEEEKFTGGSDENDKGSPGKANEGSSGTFTGGSDEGDKGSPGKVSGGVQEHILGLGESFTFDGNRFEVTTFYENTANLRDENGVSYSLTYGNYYYKNGYYFFVFSQHADTKEPKQSSVGFLVSDERFVPKRQGIELESGDFVFFEERKLSLLRIDDDTVTMHYDGKTVVLEEGKWSLGLGPFWMLLRDIAVDGRSAIVEIHGTDSIWLIDVANFRLEGDTFVYEHTDTMRLARVRYWDPVKGEGVLPKAFSTQATATGRYIDTIPCRDFPLLRMDLLGNLHTPHYAFVDVSKFACDGKTSFTGGSDLGGPGSTEGTFTGGSDEDDKGSPGKTGGAYGRFTGGSDDDDKGSPGKSSGGSSGTFTGGSDADDKGSPGKSSEGSSGTFTGGSDLGAGGSADGTFTGGSDLGGAGGSDDGRFTGGSDADDKGSPGKSGDGSSGTFTGGSDLGTNRVADRLKGGSDKGAPSAGICPGRSRSTCSLDRENCLWFSQQCVNGHELCEAKGTKRTCEFVKGCSWLGDDCSFDGFYWDEGAIQCDTPWCKFMNAVTGKVLNIDR